MVASLLPELQPEHLTETPLHSDTVYRGHFLHVRRDRVRLPDGQETVREYVVHPGAVMIVPLLSDGCLLMERQYRYPMQRAMIEFPAGKLDGQEPLFQCAERELEEETGYTAAEWAYCGAMHPVIAYATEVIHIWFARGLTPGPRRLDAGEFLDVLAVSPQALLDGCRDGTVTDAKTLTGVLWWQNTTGGQWPLVWRPRDFWRQEPNPSGGQP